MLINRRTDLAKQLAIIESLTLERLPSSPFYAIDINNANDKQTKDFICQLQEALRGRRHSCCEIEIRKPLAIAFLLLTKSPGIYLRSTHELGFESLNFPLGTFRRGDSFPGNY